MQVHARSLCPECFAEVPCAYVEQDGAVHQEKRCGEHGEFTSLVWHDAEHFRWTQGFGLPMQRNDCLAVVDVTENCNLACAYCFASSRPGLPETPRREVEARLATVRNQGVMPVQLSGGEPTTRDDLPEIIEHARGIGLEHIEVNTNGIRLGEPGYAARLKEAGAGTIYLQFDGFGAHKAIRGVDLDAVKRRAIEACRQAGLKVILVPTVVPGTNEHLLGDIVRFALANLDVVRGVNVQPVSHFGRHEKDTGHLSLPEVARLLAEQTGFLRVRDLLQVPCCSPQCSSATMLVATDDGAVPLTRFVSEEAYKDVVAAIDKTRLMDLLAGREEGMCAATDAAGCCGVAVPPGLEALMPRTLALTITGFMDADSIDLDRLSRCCIQVPVGDRMVPFCGWNLTDRKGDYALRPRLVGA